MEDVKNQIQQELGESPIFTSAKKGIGIQDLHGRITEILEKRGKDLLFLKISRYREETVRVWINGASVTAFGIGLLPIPGSDIVPLTALQVGLAMKIAYVWNCKVTKKDVMQLVAATVTGSIGKQVFRWALSLLKGAGGPAISIIAGTIAAAVTYGFGWASNAYYKSGMTMDIGDVQGVYEKYVGEKLKEKVDDLRGVVGNDAWKNLLGIFGKKG